MLINVSVAICGLLLVYFVKIVNDMYTKKLEEEYNNFLEQNYKFLQQLKEERDA